MPAPDNPILTREEYWNLPRIELIGCVDDGMVRHAREETRKLKPTENRHAKVLITLSSHGGFVNSGRAVHGEIRRLRQTVEDVVLVIAETCMSAAVTVAMAVPRERRLVTPDTNVLLHESGIEERSISGPLSQRLAAYDRLGVGLEAEKAEARIVYGLIADGCGKTAAEVEADAVANLHLIGGQAIVDYGIAGAVLDFSEGGFGSSEVPDLHLVQQAI